MLCGEITSCLIFKTINTSSKTVMAESSSYVKRLFKSMLLFSVFMCVLLSSDLSGQEKPLATYKYCLSLPSDDITAGLYFDCSKLYLKRVPSFLPISTVDLYLYNNLIKELNKYSFHQLSNLKRLNLSHNDISTITDQSFINLSYLEILDLSFNGIRSVPCNAFSRLQNLKFLRILDIVNLDFDRCSWNGVKYLTYLEISFYFNNTTIDNFRGLESIETLRIWVNYKRNDTDPIIHNCLNLSIFHTLPHLKNLDLSFGKFYCIKGASFLNNGTDQLELSGVVNLTISYNLNLTEILPGSFIGMPNLQNLDISSCYFLRHIDASVFMGLQNLNHLVLNSGNLVSLDNKQFAHLKALSLLDLVGIIGSETLHSFAFVGLSNTISLNLSVGNIHSIEPYTFSGFRNLTHLDLSLNEIGYIDRRILHGPSKLTHLNLLSASDPINIDPGAFQELHFLEFLGLTTNMKIELLEPLKSLTSLNWECPSPVPPMTFCGMYLFHYINVSSKYSSLYDWMSSFPHLTKIDLISVETAWYIKYPFAEGITALKFLQISKYSFYKFELISLYIPQNVDLLKHFDEWIKYIFEGDLSTPTLALDEMIPNLIKGALLYADIHVLNLTLPKYLMPRCDIDANEYINVHSLFFNSGSDTMNNVFSCFKGLSSLYLNQSRSTFPLRYIDSETFSNLDSLELLDLSGNSILFIPEKLFDSLPNLVHLNMLHNALEMDMGLVGNLSMLPAFHFDTGDEMYIYSQGCCRLMQDDYDEELTTDYLEKWLDREVCDFYSNVDRGEGYIQYNCQISKNSEHNGIISGYGDNMRCTCDLRKIEILKMRQSSISFISEGIYFKYMTHMNVSFADRYSVDVYVPQLVELDLAHSQLKLNNYGVNFRETLNLRFASFSYTEYDIRDIHTRCNQTTNRIIFQSFVGLEYLIVSHSGITALCQFYFQRLVNLRFIDLSYNKIPFVRKDMFEYNTKLSTIDLSNNVITMLDPATFKQMTYLSALYFSNNPLNCDCDKEYIQKWMKSSKNVTFTTDGSLPWQTYICAEPSSLSGKPFIMIDHHRIACYGTQIRLIAIFVLIIPILFVSRIVWKKRWHLLYNAYKKINKIKQRYPLYFRLEDDKEYDFDAFVSFSEGDSDWVDEQLQPFMEDKLEMRLCIHTRDFHGGKDIFANIEENIKKSRKIIFIVSEKFIKSSYCDLEMRLAFSMMLHALHDESILVFIMLEKVSLKDMSDILKFFVNTKTYLAWPEGDEKEDERQQFWEQLKGIVTDEWQIF
ncbi:toll-like receptor 4 [Ptychodera flava]|uniref:toll-like receptor 4 n=1 Tax=Ptychodera flava TaxID=63121 RepID=UPI00396AB0E4